MVRGLELFRDSFAEFNDRYILIGGTACDLILSDAGLAFRATKDLDVVLCIEMLDRAFGEAFWSFVTAGGYLQQQVSSESRKFYRFQKPTDKAYPEMIELFARAPDALTISDMSQLTPIPIDEDVSSLSAILLDTDYNQWIQDGRIELDGVPVVRAEHLIALKAKAWLDLSNRRAAGEHVDRRSIKKHKNDVFRLVQVIDPDYEVAFPYSIRNDLQEFLDAIKLDPVDPKSLGIPSASFEALLDVLKDQFGLD